jgi:NitT/TauT family transport system substrate-binding protein
MIDRRVFLTASGAAALATTVPAAAQQLATVRIGVATAETYAEGFYAADRGFFQRAGLDANVTMLANGAALVGAVAGGAIDIAPANTLALASAHARGLPIVILAPAALYTTARTTHALVVGKDSDVRNARDLAGKTVSIVGLRSLEELAVRSWIDANGGDSRKTAFIELPNAAQVPALLAHHIDGAMMPEPWITNAKNDTRMLCKPMDSIADHFVVTAWFTTQSWLDQNRDAAKRFVAAMQRTAAWANTNPSASGAILAKSLRLPVATVDAMVRMTMGETLNADLFQPVIDTGVKYGFFDKSFPAREMLALALLPSVPTAVIGLTFGGITADDTGYAIKH